MLDPIDLTLPLHDGAPGVAIQSTMTIPSNSFNSVEIAISSHAGTHVDAPSHFIAGGRGIDEIDLRKCIGEAVVVDVTHVRQGPIEIADVWRSERLIRHGTRLLFRTDWRTRRCDPPGENFPRFSEEIAAWIADRGVYLVGIDTPSVGPLTDVAELRSVHLKLLEREIVIVENLANLHRLPERVVLVVLPLPLAGADGAPARAVGLSGSLVVNE